MITSRISRNRTLFAAILIAFGLAARVQAQSAGSASLLHEAYSNLAHADHDYHGHRAEAMKEVHVAIIELSGRTSRASHLRTHVRTHVHTAVKDRETQNASDSQLQTAESQLEQASANVSDNVLAHVNAAIAQINTALSVH